MIQKQQQKQKNVLLIQEEQGKLSKNKFRQVMNFLRRRQTKHK
jgi:hypothetical protein